MARCQPLEVCSSYHVTKVNTSVRKGGKVQQILPNLSKISIGNMLVYTLQQQIMKPTNILLIFFLFQGYFGKFILFLGCISIIFQVLRFIYVIFLVWGVFWSIFRFQGYFVHFLNFEGILVILSGFFLAYLVFLQVWRVIWKF